MVDVLAGTPYVLDGASQAQLRFDSIHVRCAETAGIAERAQERIKLKAGKLFNEFALVQRSEIVAESNKIEGYNWSTETVRHAADLHKELLSLNLRAFTDGVRHDARVYEALGLYKAHQLAEEWAEEKATPTESDIRSLHSLVAVGESYAGRYKTAENSIQGSSLRTSFPLSVPKDMHELTSWWRKNAAPPVLQATVVHSWLTQIHPFDDGNGRMARLLANMALAQNGYPPLVLRSEADRGQYLDALAKSDEGDIVPLYDLFSQVVRRQVRVMARPDYVDEMVEQRLLKDVAIRHELWLAAVQSFAAELSKVFLEANWAFKIAGIPDRTSFHLLSLADSDGNGWFARCGPRKSPISYLLWWGYGSHSMKRALGVEDRSYPSLFVSRRDEYGYHPYQKVEEAPEMHFLPMNPRPVQILEPNDFLDAGNLEASQRLFQYLDSLEMSD